MSFETSTAVNPQADSAPLDDLTKLKAVEDLVANAVEVVSLGHVPCSEKY